MNAPFVNCSSFGWCLGQYFCPGCAQYALRRKVLDYDMSRYSCFQGYVTVCCCVREGVCHEQECPDFCAFMEGCLCNCVAISASRQYVMEKHNLASDPCDYKLIRINNCLQCFACLCDLLAIIDKGFKHFARIVDTVADIFYYMITGCMTAQVANEIDYQKLIQYTDGGMTKDDIYVPAAVVVETNNPISHSGIHSTAVHNGYSSNSQSFEYKEI